ncbi:MAG: lipoyl(octanoyl) transferase LipB [Candidatus Sumerlaeaceae bacterium]|nr:lipoyl(octanoyl) transferase LipB [Candidatus Sumerlaeaceae bacterium]
MASAIRGEDTLFPMEWTLIAGRGYFAGFWLGRKNYEETLSIMQECVAARLHQTIEDHILYVEHSPIITFGRATPAHHLPLSSAGIPLREVSRGGLATYHGPGQLVGYPIVDLRTRKNNLSPDLHAFLRALEQGLCSYLLEEWSISALTLPGKTGVWVAAHPSPRKIASIGIGVRRWVTFHGFALNISTDLTVFRQFVPCGLTDVTMTSVVAELGIEKAKARSDITLPEVASHLHPYIEESLREAGWSGKD